MTIIVHGFQSFRSDEAGEQIYSGSDGEAAQKAIAEKGHTYLRIGKLVNPQFIPVPVPARPEPTEPEISKPKSKKA